MKSSVPPRSAAILLAVASASASSPWAQTKSSMSGNPPARILQVSGKVASLDESCILLELQPDGSKQPVARFIRRPDKIAWQREAKGCSFNSLAGNKVLLKKGTEVSVSYSTENDESVLNWVVVFGHGVNHPCTGQGGFESGPATLYGAGCDGIPEPKVLTWRGPKYNGPALRNRLQGNLLLRVVILPDGTVSNVEVLQSLEDGLDRSSIAAVKEWRYAPTLGPEGHPVAVVWNVVIAFSTH